MNPTIHVPISEQSRILDRSRNQVQNQDKDKEKPADIDHPRIQEMYHHLQPARWWLASTAFPLMAGSLGPMASAFSVCSLAQTWRAEYLSGDNGHGIWKEKDVSDPAWVIGLNSASLACAIISNLVLLLNMGRRISFTVAQPIIITGWYMSSWMLICILAIFSKIMDHPDNAGRHLTQGYYYGAFAAGLYTVVSSLLLVTYYGAYRGHYRREYKLTTSQRTLMLQTIVFHIYLLAGAAVYSRIEHWRFLDAVYWADFTLLTIGIGNFAPRTHVGRGLLFPYAVGGIMILGLIVGSIRTLMIGKGKQKMRARVTEKTRRFLIHRALSGHGGHLGGLIPVMEDSAGMSSSERRKQEFEVMRQVRQIANVQRKWISLLLSLVVWMIMWLVGGVAFWRSERQQQQQHFNTSGHLTGPGNQPWTYFEALYFAYTSLLTIGYGDLYPVSTWGKPFFVFWSLLAVPTVTIVISSLGDTLVRGLRDVTIFLGELTILPGDRPMLDMIRDGLRVRSWREKFLRESSKEETDADADTETETETDTEKEKEEKEGETETEEQPKPPSNNHNKSQFQTTYHYHYLLFREIKKMIHYVSSDTRRSFDYGEWEYYLDLIGRGDRDRGSEACRGEGRGATGDTGDGKEEEWSWINWKSPLIGERSEAEWLLEGLVEALDRELRRASGEEYDHCGQGNREKDMDGDGSSEHDDKER